MSNCLVLYLKEPVEGTVKTRLAKVIGDANACELYKAFIQDSLSIASQQMHQLWYAAQPKHALQDPYFIQQGSDLGARMSHTIEEVLKHSDRVIIIGTDAPSLPAEYIQNAFDQLEHCELVLGPTPDGGYYLIGASTPVNLSDVRWSSPHALRDTRVRNQDLKTRMLSPWFDIDTAQDLQTLANQLATDSKLAPATHKAMQRLFPNS